MGFQYIKPTEEQILLMQEFRDTFERLHNDINEKVDISRGKDQSLKRLEEASFWLNKAITKNDED